jgi:SET domain-containing protein
MFLLPTYLNQSEIHGTGVFTSVDIPAGTTVWTFTPDLDWRIPLVVLEQFPEPYRTYLRAYCYQETPDVLILCGDNARFMNHSFDPNCDDGPEVTFARRDIRAGEELTCDYRAFDLESALSGLESWAAPAQNGVLK